MKSDITVQFSARYMHSYERFLIHLLSTISPMTTAVTPILYLTIFITIYVLQLIQKIYLDYIRHLGGFFIFLRA